MKLIPFLFLAACENQAITLAHEIDPCTECHAIETTGGCLHDNDSATCVRADEIWHCVVGNVGSDVAQCNVIGHRDPKMMTKSEQVCRAIPR